MEKTINCAECGVNYTYEPPKGFVDKRKYCANCSEKKKASYDGKTITAEVNMESVDVKQADTWKDDDKPRATRTAEEITLGENTKIVVSIFNTLIASDRNAGDVTELMNASIKVFKQAKEGLQ